jgi:hypothetical protein
VKALLLFGGISVVAKLNRAGEIDLSLCGNPARNGTPSAKKAKRMWKVVIAEIQDANTLDPMNAPPGAFFVSAERFARTVEYLDLAKVIRLINRMQSSRGHARNKAQLLSEKIPHLNTNRLARTLPEARADH